MIRGGAGLGLAVLLVDAYRWSKVELPETGTAERLGAEIFGSWVLLRCNTVLLLMPVELMLNAVNLILVTADAALRAVLPPAGGRGPG